MRRKSYSTDLTDKQWNVLEPLIPPAQAGGRPRTVNICEVINAIFYILANGGAWRLMPHDLPPWSTVYYYFRWWRTAGFWQQFNQALREQVRHRVGRQITPSAAMVEAPVCQDNRSGTGSRLRWRQVSQRSQAPHLG